MRQILFHLILGMLLATSGAGAAVTRLIPRLGPPIVAGNRLIFQEPSGPGRMPHRFVCIDRESGEKLWEIKDSTSKLLHPTFMLGDQLVVMTDNQLHGCDVVAGKLRLLYKTEFDSFYPAKVDDGLVLIGTQEGKDYLSWVNVSQWREEWKTAGASRLVAKGQDVLLCETATKKYDAGHKSYTLQDASLTGISRKEGQVLWRYPIPQNVFRPAAVVFSNHFVVVMGGTIACLGEKDGKAVKSVIVGERSTGITLAVDAGQVLMWIEKNDRSGNVMNSLSVPGLELRKLGETGWRLGVPFIHDGIVIGGTYGRIEAHRLSTDEKLWEGGGWGWEGVHDGCIYYSDHEPDGEHTSINRIEVKTGQRKKLYEERLPESMIEK